MADQVFDAVTAFEFDAENRTLTYAGIFAAGLSFPHGMDVSADGQFVAITTYGDDCVHITQVREPELVVPRKQVSA